MARTRYKQKPLFWYCIQYDGSNDAEMTEFCYLCTIKDGELLFTEIPVTDTNWILEDQAGIFSMMIDQQFKAFFQLDMGAEPQPS